MVFFPNCKLNLGLNIIAKRQDGYHELETVFYPLNICDALEVINNQHASNEIEFHSTGIKIDVRENENLCIRAYELLKNKFPQLPSVKMHLHKTIPTGAGLGGGSADGAVTLLILNKKYQLNLTTDHLKELALQLGSDCPFFIVNKPCFAKGRGEILEEITLDLSSYKFLLVNPNLHIDTRWAFSKIQLSRSGKNLKKTIAQPIESWRSGLINDFEEPVFQQYPQLHFIKTKLYDGGAIYASMSGSGSTFFGIFPRDTPLKNAMWPANYFVREVLTT
jgi:4-diphosphocytidyl-2-C-methyl-D-erythritol kinase